MFSNDAHARWRRRLVLVLWGLAPALTFSAPKTHCQADEKVYFSCVAGKKTVSLCGDVSSGSITKLTYRYGKPDKVELEFSAMSASGPHFMATVEPDSPRAAIREVWFDRGEHILSNAKCQRGPDSMDFFSRELVEFGDGTEHSTSHTPLLEIGDYSHPIDKLYPLPDRVFR